ncbi:MAG: hypothetical protein HY547_10195 [Elusimicrobia bacterium]|nr:hypothetical protein [Elusimicrobiota bacterium]
MGVVWAFCAGLATAALVAVAVYVIITLKQLERSARALEQLLIHLDESAKRINDTTAAASSLVQGVSNALGQTHPLIKGLLWGIKSFFSNHRGSTQSQTKESPEYERKE